MVWYEIIIRLSAALLAGGIIGFQREAGQHPAGFRTHTLVCIGAALAAMSNEFLLHRFSDMVNLDPARLSSYVISGLGFLGAGTIIKDGFRVRGLTTAASIWVTGCVGIAFGMGFYWGGLAGGVFAFLVLTILKKFEDKIALTNRAVTIKIGINNHIGSIARITNQFNLLGIHILNIKMDQTEEERLSLALTIRIPTGMELLDVLADLEKMEGIDISI